MVMPALGCDLCALYSAALGQPPRGEGFFAGVAGQYTDMGTLQVSGQEVANPLGQYLDSSTVQFLAGYNFSDRLGVQFNLPVIHRSFRRPEGFVVDQDSVFGLGDMALLGNWSAYRLEKEKTTCVWNLQAGIKFPSGSTEYLQEELNENVLHGAPASAIHGHDLTLGSGSFDGMVGTGLFARWRRAFLTAQLQYALRSEGDFDYRFANDLTWSAGPGFYLALKEHYTLSLAAIASGETKGKDTLRGVEQADTALTTVFLGPQLNFTWGNQFTTQVGVALPLFVDNSGLQAVPDYRVRGAVTWHF